MSVPVPPVPQCSLVSSVSGFCAHALVAIEWGKPLQPVAALVAS